MDLGLPFPARTARRTAIVGATVIPLDRRGALTGHTVVVHDGLIETVAPAGSVDTSRMDVIDARGRHLIPALADMHVHVRDLEDSALYLANGVAHVRNMWGRPQMLAWEQRVREGLFPGPHVSTVSPLVDGVGNDGAPIWPGSTALTEPSLAADMVRGFAKRGYQEMKVYSWLSREVFVALCRAAKEHGIRVVGHCPEGITFEEAMAEGMECFEHLTAFAYGHLRGGARMPRLRDRADRNSNDEAIRLVGREVDWDAVKRLASEMARRGVWICPTVVVWERQGQALDDALTDPDLRYAGSMAFGWKRAFETRRASLRIPETEWAALARERTAAHAKATAIMHAEGVNTMLGTDTPNPYVVPGFAVHRETALLAGAGLSPEAVLRCATTEAARYRGGSATCGTVTAGKRADLLLLRADPLASVTALREIDVFFANGSILDRAALDAALGAAVATDTRPAVAPALAAPGGRVEREGTLVQVVNGASVGSFVFRQTRLADGRVLVEEEEALRAERRSRRAELDADLTVRSLTWDVTTRLGSERGRIAREGAGYEAHVTELDGWSGTGRVMTPPLPPSPRLFATVWPRVLEGGPPPVVRALDVAAERPVVAEVPLEREAADDAAETWLVRAARPPSPPSTFRLARDGGLLEVVEPLPFGVRMLRSPSTAATPPGSGPPR